MARSMLVGMKAIEWLERLLGLLFARAREPTPVRGANVSSLLDAYKRRFGARPLQLTEQESRARAVELEASGWELRVTENPDGSRRVWRRRVR
jgi:hypothetical protein